MSFNAWMKQIADELTNEMLESKYQAKLKEESRKVIVEKYNKSIALESFQNLVEESLLGSIPRRFKR